MFQLHVYNHGTLTKPKAPRGVESAKQNHSVSWQSVVKGQQSQ